MKLQNLHFQTQINIFHHVHNKPSICRLTKNYFRIWLHNLIAPHLENYLFI